MFSSARFQGKDLSWLALPSFVTMDPNNFEITFSLPCTAEKL